MRPATCAEVECDAWAHGWVTRVPVDSEAALYIAAGHSGRAYTQTAPGEFRFSPGQVCFGASEHRLPLDEATRFLRGSGTAASLQALGAEQWLDEFGRNQQNLRTIIEKG